MTNAILLLVLLGTCLGSALSLDVCIGQADYTLLLHPADCSKYIVCRNGLTFDIQACADGKHFNRLTSSCDTPIDAACDITLIKKTWAESGDCSVCRSLCGCYAEPDCPTSLPPVTPSCPETPSPATPSPGTPAPETPAPETPSPETPATPCPETPSPGTPSPDPPSPETPATPSPGTPTPATPSPGTPATPSPETPETPSPGTPATPTPETPSPGTPATPSPETPAPGTPTPTPATPSPGNPSPGTPATPTPETPSPGTPASPSPETPAPGTPTPAPATPSPGNPSPGTPATPSPQTPATPSPETPSPATPSPATPSPVTPSCTNNLKICVGKPDYSNVYLPGSCQKYAICVSDCATVLTCPNNLIYNLVTRICDYPQNVNCPYPLNPPSGPSAGPSGTSCQQHGRCEGHPDGALFPSINSGGYVICQCECEIERPCPAGLVFNDKQLVCDYPAISE